ncbi:MmgE/PrpD family protein [Rhodococcus sp. OK519]|uniref:MmgE/PrpD family protein n=1 Tax=Rhodococcus sp. OK519 TaxID=2135729 RepID=UPI0015E6C46F
MSVTTTGTDLTTTQRLAEFAVRTRFEDLPEDVVDYTKLLILDSLACGVGASRMERTRMSHRVLERLGGPEEATVFGLGRKVSATSAAAANAEIMNLLDADDTFFNSAHFVIMNVAAALAEAERTGASGAEMIRAVAVGFDLSARVNLASSFMAFEDGQFRWSQMFGSGYASIGAAVSAGIVGGLDERQMANALALVAGTAPTARNTNTAERTEIASYKWAPNYHLAHCAMTAALMAEVGYEGEHDLFDLSPGFIEAQGFVGVDVTPLTEALGEQWWILDSAVKYFPACRYTTAPAAVLQSYLREHGLAAEDIEHIEVRLNPAAYAMTVFSEPERNFVADHRAPMKAQFNIPYVLAQVALGRTPGPDWYSDEAMRDPRAWKIAERITTAPDPSLAEEWNAQINDSPEGRPRRTRGSLTIRARGQELVAESDYAPGDPWSPETRPTWNDVATKFRNFAAGLLSESKIEQVIAVVRTLDSADDVARSLAPLLGCGD